MHLLVLSINANQKFENTLYERLTYHTYPLLHLLSVGEQCWEKIALRTVPTILISNIIISNDSGCFFFFFYLKFIIARFVYNIFCRYNINNSFISKFPFETGRTLSMRFFWRINYSDLEWVMYYIDSVRKIVLFVHYIILFDYTIYYCIVSRRKINVFDSTLPRLIT